MDSPIAARAGALAPHVPEPYIKDQVIEAARALPQPFLLREAISATGLPKFIVNRVLARLVRQGALTRFKAPMSYARFDRHNRRSIPGGAKRRVYLYQFAAGGR